MQKLELYVNAKLHTRRAHKLIANLLKRRKILSSLHYLVISKYCINHSQIKVIFILISISTLTITIIEYLIVYFCKFYATFTSKKDLYYEFINILYNLNNYNLLLTIIFCRMKRQITYVQSCLLNDIRAK